MTVVYLDTLFFLNFGLDGLLLSASKRLAGSRMHWGQTVLAATVGACYAAAVFVTRSPLLGHPITRMIAALGMVWLAAGQEEQRFRVLGVFFLLSCTLAGGVLMINRTGLGSLSNHSGFPTTTRDGFLLLLCGAGEYLLVSVLSLRPIGQKTALVPVLLTCEGRAVLLRALVDTGNLLRDPLTGESVLIADYDGVAPLFPAEHRPKAEAFQHPDQLLTQLSQQWSAAHPCLLPYRAVGTDQGLLLAVRVDRMEVEGTVSQNRLVAITAAPLSLNGRYHGIIGAETQEGMTWKW
ncbi:MAG: sigma-E processing peptidase SpoIIGA [Oscillospiraceae bacterium]|nr:sigma-E processing peptidase SpoIIGA [Oscillospiraceae bacterium]